MEEQFREFLQSLMVNGVLPTDDATTDRVMNYAASNGIPADVVARVGNEFPGLEGMTESDVNAQIQDRYGNFALSGIPNNTQFNTGMNDTTLQEFDAGGSRFDDTTVTQDPNRADPSNSVFDPLHMAAVQSVADQQTQLQNSIFNNPNFIGPGGSTQTTTFGNVPDWEAYVRNNPDLLDDFLNNQAVHGIQDIKTYGQFHHQRFGPQGRSVPTTDAQTAGYLQPTVETQLSPEDQAIFDANQRSRMGMANLGEAQLGAVAGSLNAPFGFGGMYDPSARFADFQAPQRTVDPSVGGYEAIRDAMVGRNQSRLDQERQSTINDLLIQGHNPGTEAWDNRMRDLVQKENDFELAAQLAAGDVQGRLFGMEGAARREAFDEAERTYNVDRDWETTNH